MRFALARAQMVMVLAIVAAGCDSITGNKSPKITLRASNNGVTVGQGSSATVTVFVDRTKFDKPVTLTVEGAPAGISASLTPTLVDNTVPSATLIIGATGAAIPGNATLTVRATGEGVSERTLTIATTVTPTGSFTVASLDPAITVAQSGGGVATVQIQRAGGNVANVALAVSGLPAGLSASASESPTVNGTSTLIFAATGSVPTGTHTVTVTGSSPAFTNQTATIAITVIPPLATAPLTMAFCANDTPVWVAFKNEGAAWQQVLPSGTAFTMQATDRVGVAFVFSGGGDTDANVFFATRGELSSFTDRDCGGSKTLSGSVAGVATGQFAHVTMGNASTLTTSTFTLGNVNARALDVVAARGQIVNNEFFTPDKLIVRRSLDLASGATIPVFDFDGSEAATPATTTLSITGARTSEQIQMQNTFWSRTSTFHTMHTAALTSTSTPLLSLPASSLLAGDVHELFIDAFLDGPSSVTGHSYVQYFAAPADITAAMGPTLPTPTLGSVTATPYSRLRARVLSQAEYATSMRVGFFQENQLAGLRSVQIGVSAGYLGGTPATWEIVVPDFNGTTAFNATWMLQPGAPITYFIEGFSGRTDLLFGALPSAGDQVRFAYQVAALTVTLLRDGAARSDLMSVVSARVPLRARRQYFSR